MKPTKIFLVLIAVTSSLVSYSQSNKRDTCFYEIHVPPDIDMPKTPHFDTSIVRNNQCSTQILRLQSWGTETSYSLYSSKDSILTKGAKPIRSCAFGVHQKGEMDIGDLAKGTYTMWLVACGNGGFFTVRIK